MLRRTKAYPKASSSEYLIKSYSSWESSPGQKKPDSPKRTIRPKLGEVSPFFRHNRKQFISATKQ
jgi:hypothetical protein